MAYDDLKTKLSSLIKRCREDSDPTPAAARLRMKQLEDIFAEVQQGNLGLSNTLYVRLGLCLNSVKRALDDEARFEAAHRTLMSLNGSFAHGVYVLDIG